MASGSLGAEEAREKPRWNENSKVYTRKIKSKTTQNSQNTLPPANAQNSQASNGNSSATETTTAAAILTVNADGNAASTTTLTTPSDGGMPVTAVSSSMATDDEPLTIPLATAKDSDKERDANLEAATKNSDVEISALPVAVTKDTDEERIAVPVMTAKETNEETAAVVPAPTTKETREETAVVVPVTTSKDIDEERASIATTNDSDEERAAIATTKDTDEERVSTAVTASKDTDIERETIPVDTTKDTDDERVAVATSNDADEEPATAAVATPMDTNDERVAVATSNDADEEPVTAAVATPMDTNDERAATTVADDDETAATTTAVDIENTAATMSTCLTVRDDNGNYDTRMPDDGNDAPMPDNDNGVISLEDHRTNNGDNIPAMEINRDPPPLALARTPPSLYPAEDVNDLQHHSNSLRTEAVVSEDSSTLNQQVITIPNGGSQRNVEANGLMYVKPAVTWIDGKVSICLSAFRSKKEVKDLKRKLLGELQMVRNVSRKLEEKEVQMSVAVNNVIDPLTIGPVSGGGRIRFPANDGMRMIGNSLRVNTQAHSAGFNESRPFRPLSVSVVNSSLGAGEIVEKEKRTPKANQFYRSADFIYGKDKLPTTESHKKHKSSSKKHGGSGGGGVGVGGFSIDKQLFKKCSSLLQRVMKHKHGWVFNTPVDVRGLGLHDYYDIIKQPMDLGTVKNRLNTNWYKSPFEFAEDVRLTFRNARTYNPEGQDVHVMAVELSNIFEEKWAEIESDYNRKLRYEMSYNVGLPTPRTRVPTYVAPPMPYIPAPSLSTPYIPQDPRRLDRSESLNLPVESRPKTMVYHTPATRTPAPKKPKAKDPNKRDMTFEEKQKLSTHLQALPSEKLDNIVQIIKKRNSALSQGEDEIEVDIDSVDAETLWELDRFVTNYKKSLSKHKRKAELALQARAAAEQAGAAQQMIHAPPSGAEMPRETITDETNVAASSPVQEDKQTNNASGSSSSSSSSSDSGSSSSDSDSDSSSGSGSDGGP